MIIVPETDIQSTFRSWSYENEVMRRNGKEVTGYPGLFYNITVLRFHRNGKNTTSILIRILRILKVPEAKIN
jgi:hypothetical protein